MLNVCQTLAARVSLSPDSPTQIFKHNFRIFKSRITFLLGSLPAFPVESASTCWNSTKLFELIFIRLLFKNRK